MSSRDTSDGYISETDEAERFSELLDEDIKPLSGKGANRVAVPAKLTPGMLERRRTAQQEPLATVNFLHTTSYMEQVDPFDHLAYRAPGIQQAVYRQLRQGKYAIQSRLDLHQHTVEQARQALWLFVADCHQHAVRCALITHGKGEGREQPARLKSCVNHWLRQFDQVLAFHTAQKRHGGAGSTYVLLKNSSAARQKT